MCSFPSLSLLLLSILFSIFHEDIHGFQLPVPTLALPGHQDISTINPTLAGRKVLKFASPIPKVQNPQSKLLKSSPFTSTTATTLWDCTIPGGSEYDVSTFPYPNTMKDCVCVVTGASRGIGRGIALELGRAGATVYVTGTSSSSSNNTNKTQNSGKFVTNEDVGGPGTIEDTASEVTSVGGRGIPVYCDHSNDEQVSALFDRIRVEEGRLDLLVNNAFRVPPGGAKGLFGKFWEEGGIEIWDSVHTVGLRSHYVASAKAIPLMMANSPSSMGNMPRPMIAMVSSFGGLCYTFNVAYGVGKGGVDRLAKDMAVELGDKIGVTSLYPGVVLTERMAKTVENGDWDREVGIPIDNAESPAYTGRAIIAIATDPTNKANDKDRSGTIQVVAELAEEYGFLDANGRRPPSIRSMKFLLPAYGMDKETREKIPDWLIPNWKLPFFIMAQGQPSNDN